MVVANASSVDIPALKARHPLGDAVEAAGVRLRGRGRVRQGVCPFHDEVEGSFTVYSDSERYFCFGCGDGGDVLDFIQRVEGLSLADAIRRLDGGAYPAATPSATRRGRTVERRSTAAVLPPRDPALLTAAARFYAGRLRRSSAARGYLASRGVGLDAALRLGLGFAPGDGLREAVESSGFTAERLRDSSLFTERGSERFAGMVVVPEVAGGLVRWLAGRAVDPDAAPRFQALPGPKPVLGLGRLGFAPPWAVLAEGVFDWLAIAGWGIPACAALGTQGVEKAAASLRGCPRVFLAFDSDDAGREATERLEGLLGRRAATVSLPEASATWASLRRIPTVEPSSCACWLWRLAPPDSGSFPLPAPLSPLPELDPLRPCLRDSLPLHPIPTLTAQEDLCPIHDGACLSACPAHGFLTRSPHRSFTTGSQHIREGDTK